jgi:predicted ATP-grasp superfamily ATP-dependent carboligase
VDWFLSTNLPLERVLFTGGRSPATLALLRLFAAHGTRAYVAESIPFNLAGASRFCQKSLKVPPPAQESAAFVAALEQYLKEYRIELLIPTCEEVFYVSRWKQTLEKHCEVFTSTIDVLTNLHSKYQFVQILGGLKLSAPETVRVETSAQLEAALAEYPQYVLKAEFSRFSSHVLINQPVQQALTEVQPSPEQAWVVQRFLPGQQFCSYTVARAGKIRAHCVYASVHCVGQGSTIYFESVSVPEIEQIVAKIVDGLDYTGQIAFDFIYSEGRYWPIECNPRATTGTLLFEPQDGLSQAFAPGDAGPVHRPGGDRNRMVAFAMWLFAMPQVRSLSAFQTLWAEMQQADDAVFRADDLQPFWAQFQLMFETWRRSRKHKTDLLSASTLDIEWNGHWPKQRSAV